MKIKFEGDMSLNQFGKLVAELVGNFLEEAGADKKQVKLNNPIVQTAFQIKGQEHAVFLTTEHGEMLQVEAKTEKGKLVSNTDNQDAPTEDKRLWSNDKIVNEPPTAVTDEEITSDFDQTQIEFKEEFVINSSLKQKVYRIIGSEDELVRYFNMEKNVLIGEEVVSKTPVANAGE